MSELTIVTAFFDVGRKDFEILSRKNEKYLNDFACWARIQNKLIVYTQPQFQEAIMNIREKFNQGHNTEIIVIDDVFAIDQELYQSYENITKTDYLEKYKMLQGTISANKPKYNYIVLLKFWFLMDAERRGLIDDFAVWLDFGYGHGDFFANPAEFDFKWKYDFDRKITLFTCHDVDDTPMFEVIRCSLNYIMSFHVIVPKELCRTFWEEVREAAWMLTQMGFMDDDQVVLLAAYKNHPEHYKLIADDWFMPIVTHGGEHLTLSKDVKTSETVAEPKGLSKAAGRLLKKSKQNRTGVYGLLDKYRSYKMSKQKSSLEINCEKYATDCAKRTYEQVYRLYYNDRSH